MRVIVGKNDNFSEVVESLSSIVDGKFYYIPGWFQKDENGDFQFHHMNNLPEELKQSVEKLKNPKKPKK